MLTFVILLSLSWNDRREEDNTFGWQLFHDRQRNLIYYLHSYTGEVRWPRPETVGFVMHGLKPIPASAGLDARTDSIDNPDIWNPFYPHVVMLPSGLVQVHPGPDNGTAEMWCGYNRFPLPRSVVDDVHSEQHRTKKIDQETSLGSTTPRILPPTWEESHCGSPFLPPYPVAILQRDATAPSPLHPPPEQFLTRGSDDLHKYSHCPNGALERLHGSMDWTRITRLSATKESFVPKQQPGELSRLGTVVYAVLES